MTSVSTSARGTLEPLYAAIGVLALVVAWGGWRLHPWAYRLAWVFQGLVFVVVIGGIVVRIAGKPAPLGWLLLDTAFGAYNVWWLLQPEHQTRVRQTEGGVGTRQTEDDRVSNWDEQARARRIAICGSRLRTGGNRRVPLSSPAQGEGER